MSDALEYRRGSALPNRRRVAGAVQDDGIVVDRHRRHRRGHGARERRGVEVDDAAGRAAAAADVPPEAVAADAVRGDDADARDGDAGTAVAGHSAYNTHPRASDPTDRTASARPGRRARLRVGRCRGLRRLVTVLPLLLSVRFGSIAAPGPIAAPIAIDVVLFTIFALHHSVFARPAVKGRVAALLPAPLERSLYTWIASALFLVVCAAWRDVPGELYHLTGAIAGAGYVVQAIGIWLTARSSARLDVLDLAGVRPVLNARGLKTPGPQNTPLPLCGPRVFRPAGIP